MSLKTQPAAVLSFGAFEVDLCAGELRKQGKRIKLQEQPLLVLKVLLGRPGEIVTRDELRSQIWSADTFVDFDNSLNTSINKLREALGDSADRPRFIETIPRRGYRFIAPVAKVETRGAPATTAGVRTRTLSLSVAVVALALLGAGLYWRSRQNRPLTEKDTVVLADFTNTTGDPVFDETLKQGLRVQLEQSPFLNILSDERVSEQVRLMERPADERLTANAAREVCQRIGSKAVLLGSVSSLGTHYVLGLKALNCRTGEGLGNEQVEVESREQVLKALNRLTTNMRKKLGESLVTIQKYDAPVEQATTGSLEALQAYSLGLKIWNAAGAGAALPFFQRAVTQDPKFAMAYGRMGTAYSAIQEEDLGIENTRKSFDLREKVSEREKLYIESHYYQVATGELEKAANIYEVWQQIYPQDPVPHDNLEGFYAVFGQYDKALQQAIETLDLDPYRVTGYEDASESYIALDRLGEAEAVFRKAEERNLSSEGLLWNRYVSAFLSGDRPKMERLVGSATENSRAKGMLLSLAASSEAYQGHRRRARELIRHSVEVAVANKTNEAAATYQIRAGLIEAYFGDPQQARADVDVALKLYPKGFVPTYGALVFALTGDAARADKLTGQQDRRFASATAWRSYCLPTIRAAAALQRRNALQAIELLRAASPFELGSFDRFDPIYLRGEAYLMLHDGRAAVTEFRKMIDHPGVMGVSPLGALAHLGLARAHNLLDDTGEAKKEYQHFFNIWKDADPDIPIYKEAKGEYAKLQ